MINFYCDDVLNVMSNIPSWDLVIADGPSLDDMLSTDAIQRLHVARGLAKNGSVLFYYGVNIDNCIRLVDRSGWQIRNTFTLYSDGPDTFQPAGIVVQAASNKTDRMPKHQRWIDRMAPSIWVEPKGPHTDKSEDWFLPFIEIGEYSHCLDMYCGFGGAARACDSLGIDCSAVDILPSSIEIARWMASRN